MKKIVLLALFCVAIASVFAQENKPAIEGKPSKDVEMIRLANNLAKYGYENFSALSLIEAASILNDIATQELNPVSFEKGLEGENSGVKKDKPGFTVDNLLSDATKFADGNENLLALVNEAKAKVGAVTRGRVGGPGRTVSSVNGNSSDTYQIRFIANQYAEILVSGDGDTDLDLYVYDSNGNLIVKDDDYTDDCYVRWIPAWTGNFIVKIVNRGPVYNNYVLVTN
ncbi:MAG: hypothetical protein Q4B70_18310 [Lachnospiraceae bacterium]|nr:hypothetical protein [Lachnospiraceae bacterium]